MDHYIRLIVFAVEGCPQPLVELFLKKAKADTRPGVQYTTINTYLQYHQPTIQYMLRRRFIHIDQLPLILPGPTDPVVDIATWDISLVTTMLQNVFSLSAQEQQYIGDIRSVRNELLHKSGPAELDETEFTDKWNILDAAVKGLALCVGVDCKNKMTSYIANLKTKPLPPPGPVFDIVKQWYKTDKELHQDTKLARDAAIAAKNIINDVTVCSTKPSGAVLKKVKTIDPILENMKEQFTLTMKRFQNKSFHPPNEIEDSKCKFRRYHRAVFSGNGSIESALTVIHDQGIRHDRCVQLTEPDEARHVYCDDVDLVLCINPFGTDVYDETKATEMTKQFDKMLENSNLTETDGRIYVMIVSETAPFLEYCKNHDHDILDQVVALNKATTEATPIHLSDASGKTSSLPESVLQNMIDSHVLVLNKEDGSRLSGDDNPYKKYIDTLLDKHYMVDSRDEILVEQVEIVPDYIGRRKGRKNKFDPEFLDVEKLTGEENVSVIHRLTKKKVTGAKAPTLRCLAEWLEQNPMWDVDSKWAELVRAKGSLTKNLLQRVLISSRRSRGPRDNPLFIPVATKKDLISSLSHQTSSATSQNHSSKEPVPNKVQKWLAAKQMTDKDKHFVSKQQNLHALLSKKQKLVSESLAKQKLLSAHESKKESDNDNDDVAFEMDDPSAWFDGIEWFSQQYI